MAELDISELQQLRRSVESRGGNIAPFARKAVEYSAREAKDTARSLAIGDLGGGHAGRYPYAIDYQLGASKHAIWADVGPDKGKAQGALGNLIEYGGGYSGAHGHLTSALEATVADFEKGLELAADDALQAALG